jgi:hypothetical protein
LAYCLYALRLAAWHHFHLNPPIGVIHIRQISGFSSGAAQKWGFGGIKKGYLNFGFASTQKSL